MGQCAEFKPVSILAEEDNYILVTAADTSTTTAAKKALRAGDQIIISSGELYDGKVID